ncbi:MAG TPA: DotU family type IV/VI secretion system protein [Gemmataceae bacterium]|nr:DotU family type IV/VI secretion system protein [Gemmataceae bacterium]
MRKDIADLVYPVITHALRVKEQLSRGEEADWQREQSNLKGLLKGEAEAQRWPEYVGNVPQGQSAARAGPDAFLGIRYALVCWLDDLFILDSPWREEWTENTLELALYGTRNRAERFWEQARRAEARAESDALEVFFLCVMLGFRGSRDAQPPEGLKAWRESAHAQIASKQSGGWRPPPAPDPVIDVPPLYGAGRFRSMVMTVGLVVLMLIPAAAFFLVWRLGKGG